MERWETVPTSVTMATGNQRIYSRACLLCGLIVFCHEPATNILLGPETYLYVNAEAPLMNTVSHVVDAHFCIYQRTCEQTGKNGVIDFPFMGQHTIWEGNSLRQPLVVTLKPPREMIWILLENCINHRPHCNIKTVIHLRFDIWASDSDIFTMSFVIV